MSIVALADGRSVHLRMEQLTAEIETASNGNRTTLTQVAELCRKPQPRPTSIATRAADDVAFAALLIELANGERKTRGPRIEELSIAVSCLGFPLVEGLAIATPTLRMLSGPPDNLVHARRSLELHAVRAGLIGRRIASAPVSGDQALTAGLLHNVGLAALSKCEPVSFRLLAEVGATGTPLGPTEAQLFGFTHAEFGAFLAERWCYPDWLTEAIREHDDPQTSSQLVATVQIADLLARRSGVGIEPPTDAPAGLLETAAIDPDATDTQLALILSPENAPEDNVPSDVEEADRFAHALQSLVRAS